jgi:hypothetical protein
MLKALKKRYLGYTFKSDRINTLVSHDLGYRQIFKYQFWSDPDNIYVNNFYDDRKIKLLHISDSINYELVKYSILDCGEEHLNKYKEYLEIYFRNYNIDEVLDKKLNMMKSIRETGNINSYCIMDVRRSNSSSKVVLLDGAHRAAAAFALSLKIAIRF